MCESVKVSLEDAKSQQFGNHIYKARQPGGITRLTLRRAFQVLIASSLELGWGLLEQHHTLQIYPGLQMHTDQEFTLVSQCRDPKESVPELTGKLSKHRWGWGTFRVYDSSLRLCISRGPVSAVHGLRVTLTTALGNTVLSI